MTTVGVVDLVGVEVSAGEVPQGVTDKGEDLVGVAGEVTEVGLEISHLEEAMIEGEDFLMTGKTEKKANLFCIFYIQIAVVAHKNKFKPQIFFKLSLFFFCFQKFLCLQFLFKF